MSNCRDVFTDPYKHFMYHATEFRHPGKSTGPRLCTCLPFDIEKTPNSRLHHLGLCAAMSVPGINAISHLALKKFCKSRLKNFQYDDPELLKRLQIDEFLITNRLQNPQDYVALEKFVTDQSIPIYMLYDFLSKESMDAFAGMVKTVSFGEKDPPELVVDFLSHAACIEDLKIINNSVEELPDTVKKCKSFELHNCNRIQSIPNLFHCETFSAINCLALQKLPQLTRCKSVSCSKCPQITRISKLLCCESLIANQCENLSAVELLPNCKLLKVCFCPKLVSLPNLSSCERLYIYNTPIKMLPKLHYAIKIFAGNLNSLIWSDEDEKFKYSIKGYEVDFPKLRENPRNELVRLARNFVNQDDFPLLTLKFEKGVKFSDPTVEEIFTKYIRYMSKCLFRDIKECRLENALQHIWFVDGIPFGDRNVDIVDCLRTIGWLMGLCIDRKVPFRIQPRLNPQVYDWILNIQDDHSIEWIKHQFHNSCRKYNGDVDQMLFAVGLISAGLQSYFGKERWREIQRNGVENLQKSVEGVS